MGSKIVKALREAGKVAEALSGLMLKVGTLVAIVKMIWDSIQR